VENLAEIEEEILKCTKCRLHASRRKPVPGEGNPRAAVMLIGEAPGEAEDLQGRPFVGPAGKLLTEVLRKCGVRREDVYITNVVKCRPPNNREPEDDEIRACSQYLLAQIRALRPKLIITLGRVSTKFLMSLANVKVNSILSVRGRVYRVKVDDLEVDVFPTVHPAAALYNPKYRGLLESDLTTALSKVGGRRTLNHFLKD